MDVSIHAPRAGRDAYFVGCVDGWRSFNPRAPCGARPIALRNGLSPDDVSIHAPRAGRDGDAVVGVDGNVVSIHAPRAGRDVARLGTHRVGCVSIHAPRAGRDPHNGICLHDGTGFQSTRPVRGATISVWKCASDICVSIHAPRAGRDSNWRHDFPLLPHIYGYSPPQIMIFSVPKSHAPPIT